MSTVGIDSQTTITAVQSKSKSDCHVQGSVDGVSTNFLVDTGADVSLLSIELWKQVEATAQSKPELEPGVAAQVLVGVQGSPLQIHGVASVEVELAKEKFSSRVIIVDSLTSEAILGKDFLKANKCVIDVGRNTLHFETRGVTLSFNSPPGSQQVARVAVTLNETLEIPAHSEMEVMAGIPGAATEGTWMMEQEEKNSAVRVARALVTPEQKEVPVRLLNLRDKSIIVRKGTAVAKLDAVSAGTVGPTFVSAVQCGAEVSEEKQQLLWKVVENAGLPEYEQEQLFALLFDYANIFVSDQDDLGHIGKIEHKINTGDSPPIRQPVRRIPPIRQDEAHSLLQGMLQNGVIKLSTSPWASPIVLVRKKDGSTRFCIDYRKVNHMTRKDAYPIPRVDDILDTLAGSQYFSTLDLLSGYWHVEVDKEDQDKTTFCTPDELFEFQVIRIMQCPRYFSAADGASVGGIPVDYLFSLP